MNQHALLSSELNWTNSQGAQATLSYPAAVARLMKGLTANGKRIAAIAAIGRCIVTMKRILCWQ